MQAVRHMAVAIALAFGMAAVPAAQAEPLPGLGRDGHPCQTDRTGKAETSPLCPTPIHDGTSCVSYGAIVIERDTTGAVGSVTTYGSGSRADAERGPGFVEVPFPGEFRFPSPPERPDAQSSAQVAGAAYSGGITSMNIDAAAVHSRCDVESGEGPGGHGYGRGGAGRLAITDSSGATVLDVRALDFELAAYGMREFAHAYVTCSALGILPGFNMCPSPNTSLALGAATVSLNEELPPVRNLAGQWVYAGAAVHVQVSGVTGVVDAYIGYVAVAVPGGEGFPPFFVGERGPLG